MDCPPTHTHSHIKISFAFKYMYIPVHIKILTYLLIYLHHYFVYYCKFKKKKQGYLRGAGVIFSPNPGVQKTTGLKETVSLDFKNYSKV